jgi:N6-L-threonylcarbamoyladenine synthase
MKVLGIETSCDETALALIEVENGTETKFKTLGTVIHSQIEEHKPFGGVMPILAKREHARNLVPLLNSLLEKTNLKQEKAVEISAEQRAKIEEILSRENDLVQVFLKFISTVSKPDIDMLAVTSGPGLEPALWVGISFAKALSYVWNVPLIPTNHMEGHIVSVLKEGQNLRNFAFPAVALLISGGHTELVLVKNWGDYQLLGQTRDDAVGEAFDKVARLLGLPYPGGPQISKLAEIARSENLKNDEIKLPRPMLHSKDFDFSFAGLKTSVLYLTDDLKKENKLDDATRKIIAREFEDAVTEVLFKKTKLALEECGAETLIIGGGVIANTTIRHKFAEQEKDGVTVLIPEMSATTDNALMIAIAGYMKSCELFR